MNINWMHGIRTSRVGLRLTLSFSNVTKLHETVRHSNTHTHKFLFCFWHKIVKCTCTCTHTLLVNNLKNKIKRKIHRTTAARLFYFLLDCVFIWLLTAHWQLTGNHHHCRAMRCHRFLAQLVLVYSHSLHCKLWS